MRTMRSLFWLVIGVALSLVLVPMAHAQVGPWGDPSMPPQPQYQYQAPQYVQPDPGVQFFFNFAGSLVGAFVGTVINGRPRYYEGPVYPMPYPSYPVPYPVYPSYPRQICRQYVMPGGYPVYNCTPY